MDAKRILLIAPASGPWRSISRKPLFSGKTFRFSMLSLLTVAVLTPPRYRVRIIDEQIEEAPLDDLPDLVGITCMTAAAPRAYALADAYRARGVPVVLGGFHPSLNPDEALQHADAVVTGTAYGAWERALDDFEAGRLRGRYVGDPDAAIPVHLPRHLLDAPGAYITANATFASIGCARGCRFCSISAFHGARRRMRPVQDVVAEVARFDRRFFMFVDDDLVQDHAYAMELMAGLAPLKKRWVTQVSADAADDPALLDAMAAAGCIGVFIGVESFRPAALADQAKTANAPDRYRDWVRAYHRRGIFVEAGIMFGFDGDGPDSFTHTLRMLEHIGIDAIQASIVTPLPGTPLHDAWADRIVDRDWTHYDFRHAVYTPVGMTRSELQDGADWVIHAYYTPGRIARRCLRWLGMPHGLRTFIYPLTLNLAYLGRVRRFGIRGRDPAATPLRQRLLRLFGVTTPSHAPAP